MQNLTKVEIVDRRKKKNLPGASMKTLERDFTEFNVRPAEVRGRLLLFAPDEIEELERKKREARLARYVNGGSAVKLPTMAHLRAENAKVQRKAVRS